MGIRVGMCGVGSFARNFIPLFKAHPDVENMILCDLDAEKLATRCEEFGIEDRCRSLDELCTLDVDAIVIITQHHLHGPQAVQALKAGKHVYSAVPSAISMEEITELVKTVEATGNIYMIGETSYYYPCAIFCRDKFHKGEFGQIVYSEGEYMHDYLHGMIDVAKWRYGKDWKQKFGMPPLFYPTHSTSMIVSVSGAYATHVCGMGIPDHRDYSLPPKSEEEKQYRLEDYYARDDSYWENPFSNETMLCKMSDGSVARINEFRRVGHPGTVGMSMYGTDGSYEQQSGATGTGYSTKAGIWVNKNLDERMDVTDLLACGGVPASDVPGNMDKVTAADGTHEGASKLHDLSRLPKEFIGLPNGHAGSHQFLVDDFVRACVSGRTPPNNVWDAARYLIPGLVAHESAMKGGELMEVPDFGNPHA
ncbi:MAG: Gfo/Idh/MocA family oxidoreductase [Candidatus Pacebacteria bacterium]|nr:Gfo/Idh/MocA family oxidoreductase [Candidatus Paceibacterota bacterium]